MENASYQNEPSRSNFTSKLTLRKSNGRSLDRQDEIANENRHKGESKQKQASSLKLGAVKG